jgi:putative intracellular protease/amidase
MKRFIILVLVLVLGFSLYANGNKKRVLLFIRHGSSADTELMLQQEVGVMISMLEEAGFKVIVATDSGEPILWGEAELLKPDLKLAAVRVNDYVGIIMPCVAKVNPGPDPEEISLVKEAVAQGKPIAAQCNAIVILAEAGVLEGKKHTFQFVRPRLFGFDGAIYSGKGVIRDGKIITSSFCPFEGGCVGYPEGTPVLTKLFIEAIKD